jgi:hypothetical protein
MNNTYKLKRLILLFVGVLFPCLSYSQENYLPGYLKKEITTSYSGTDVYEGSPLVQTKDYEQGFILGIGIKSKKLSFETRIERGDGMINVPSISASVTRCYFLLGYNFI